MANANVPVKLSLRLRELLDRLPAGEHLNFSAFGRFVVARAAGELDNDDDEIRLVKNVVLPDDLCKWLDKYRRDDKPMRTRSGALCALLEEYVEGLLNEQEESESVSPPPRSARAPRRSAGAE